MDASLHFLLVPDVGAARRLKRLIAGGSARLGVVVGTWGDLLRLAEQTYRPPSSGRDREAALRLAATSLPGAFWSKSFEVAPEAVLERLDETLTMLLHAAPPACGTLPPDTDEALSGRGTRCLADLGRLHESIQRLLPPELALIDAILSSPPPRGGAVLRLYRSEAAPRLTRRQTALVEKITGDFGSGTDNILQESLESLFRQQPSGGSALGLLQSSLFEASRELLPCDESLCWIAVRDCREEADIAAGMIQRLRDEHPGISHAEIGLLLPDDSGYSEAAGAACALAGIPLSGLKRQSRLRDLGGEAVASLIAALQVPAPRMAQAALAASPLMPWPSSEGERLAQALMDGNPLPAGNPLAQLTAARPATPDELAERLKTFVRIISAGHGPKTHLNRARGLAADLLAQLTGQAAIDWRHLERLATPQTLTEEAESSFSREGVTVYYENQEPWRPCRVLFVLGFSSGRYPAISAGTPLFSRDDLRLMRDRLGYRLELDEDRSARRRELFKRQLGAARDEAIFLVPRRDGSGEPLYPSESLTFMAQLFEGVTSPEELLLECERREHRPLIRYLATACEREPEAPRRPETDDPRLGSNLLTLRTDAEGNQKPESPSGLETLLVSPLMWLLHRYKMEPRQWAPDTLDTMTRGSLAHRVFEQLFAPGRALPEPAEIGRLTPPLFAAALQELFPLLATEEWRVERCHLERDIEKAALAWSEMLRQLQATVCGTEVPLAGRLGTLPVSGTADLLLSLPGGRMLVVDYKKSGSKGRMERMRKGYDMQASLYRTMLQTGGAVSDESLKTTLSSIDEIGIMYYLLNDQTAVTDSSGWTDGEVPGLHEMGDAISSGAMELLRERIRQLEEGQIALNTTADEEWFGKKAGITPYAFDNSPLVRLFMREG